MVAASIDVPGAEAYTILVGECHRSCRLRISRAEKCLAFGRLATWLDAAPAVRAPSPEEAGRDGPVGSEVATSFTSSSLDHAHNSRKE
jgi:hypothetical protein